MSRFPEHFVMNFAFKLTKIGREIAKKSSIGIISLGVIGKSISAVETGNCTPEPRSRVDLQKNMPIIGIPPQTDSKRTIHTLNLLQIPQESIDHNSRFLYSTGTLTFLTPPSLCYLFRHRPLLSKAFFGLSFLVGGAMIYSYKLYEKVILGIRLNEDFERVTIQHNCIFPTEKTFLIDSMEMVRNSPIITEFQGKCEPEGRTVRIMLLSPEYYADYGTTVYYPDLMKKILQGEKRELEQYKAPRK